MPIRRGIAEVFEAIPDRIEVSGHEPTWRITGGSFDAVVDYAHEAFVEPVVIAREDRTRWWPRVTLTVTTDPDLAATAPPLEALTDPGPEPELVPEPGLEPVREPVEEAAEESMLVPKPRGEENASDSFLDEAFARQEQARAERLRIPAQRRGA